MTRSELIALYAKSRNRKKKEAEADVNFIFDAITEALARDEKVVLTGFGTFNVKDRKGKRCLNPRSKRPMQLPPGRAAVFRSGRGLRDAVDPKKDQNK